MPSIGRLWRFFWMTVLGLVALAALTFGAVLLFVVSQFDGSADFPADCGVVFGAAVWPSAKDASGAVVLSQPGPGITRRVQTAVDLYKNGQLRRIFVTGGRGDGMPESEAQVMRRFAVQQGVKPSDVMMETNSHSTEENIALTQNLTSDCSDIVAISDRYHLARISYIAWVDGWPVATHPASRVATRRFEVYSVVREALGILHFTFERITGIRILEP